MQMPLVSAPAFFTRNIKSRPLVVLRALLGAVHDTLRR
jgi:hypothetical protein